VRGGCRGGQRCAMKGGSESNEGEEKGRALSTGAAVGWCDWGMGGWTGCKRWRNEPTKTGCPGGPDARQVPPVNANGAGDGRR